MGESYDRGSISGGGRCNAGRCSARVPLAPAWRQSGVDPLVLLWSDSVTPTISRGVASAPSYDALFHPHALVSRLARFRMQAGIKRNERAFWHGMFASAEVPWKYREEVDHILPPRRQWQRPGRRARGHRSPAEIDRDAIIHTALRALQGPDATREPWAQRLQAFLTQAQALACSPGKWVPEAPEPIAIAKSGASECRILNVFRSLTDRTILGQVARYLTVVLDPLWHPASYAFRHDHGRNRQACVSSLQAYARRQAGPLYVAECDIQQFYNSISHAVVSRAYRRTAARLQAQGVVLDPRAGVVLQKYLDCYSYAGDAEKRAQAIVARQHPGRSLAPLPDALRALHGAQYASARIGIPQGGALSPVIANLVLDHADRAVCSGADDNLFYARYCDDIILAHPDPEQCRAALGRYMQALSELMLVPHEPMLHGAGMAEATDAPKSKQPYEWLLGTQAKDGEEQAAIDLQAGEPPALPAPTAPGARWVQFLGYEISRDGLLRVREGSIQRQEQAVARVVSRAIKLLGAEDAKLPGYRVLSKIQSRLVCQAAGKDRLTQEGVRLREHCWADAFSALCGSAHGDADHQMRALDCHREAQVRRLVGYLRQNHWLSRPKGAAEAQKPNKKRRFHGAPDSYYSILGETSAICGRPPLLGRSDGYGL